MDLSWCVNLTFVSCRHKVAQVGPPKKKGKWAGGPKKGMVGGRKGFLTLPYLTLDM
jgi:hypothetical protein